MHSLGSQLDLGFHALFISDVLHLICDLLEVSDWMSLMLTCKSMFATAASHIWASLDGVQVLTDLLVEATVVGNNITTSNTAVNFSRFDIYAPLVRHLHVYGRTSKYLRGEYRRRCALRSQQSSLFAKLESITMCTSDLFDHSDALMWIEILAAPTLAELRVIPIKKPGATAFVSYSATANISKLLSDLCPRIKKFEFYPSNVIINGKDEYPSNKLWQAHLRQSFESFVNLREVTSSVLLVDGGGLAILGALPCLEKLSIDGCNECPRDLQLVLSSNLFPALAHLSLVKMDPDSLLALMSLPPLVQRLTSVTLNQRFYLKESYDLGDWLTQKLPLLLHHTPSLKSFTYDAGEINPHGSLHTYYVESSSLLKAISVRKLEYISLSKLQFPLDFVTGIAAACPSLAELHMPDYYVLNDNLHWLARLPKLKHLTLSLNFSDVPISWYSFNGPLETLVNTESNLSWDSPAKANQVATFLLSLWPNLRLVAWPSRSRLRQRIWRGQRAAKRVKAYWCFIDDLNAFISDKRLLEAEVE